ncbi:hypothetical protein OBBRIDRAFT_314336 [Obba rivulosa]|uniref:F-box domain-containing protein n=1 Tax=Obba rivulosa TaxID=1052685 RepID=A0A8E2AU75_9APHY|nr:hypothetical protein OBBRIDRAFT_314336 [Obba rivulosa]
MSSNISQRIASHPSLALQNDYILRNVCDKLDRWDSDLANLARVCKAFSEPSLSVLWRRPSKSWSLGTIIYWSAHAIEWNSGAGIEVMSGHIVPEEWRRFQFYTRWIQEFAYNATHPDGYFASTEVLRALSHKNNGNPLLPALKRLYWHQYTREDTMSLFTLLPTSFEHLHLSYTPREDESSGTSLEASIVLGICLSELASRAPRIRKLQLIDIPDLSGRWTQPFALFGSLNDVRIYIPGDRSLSTLRLESLSAVPHLTRLELKFCRIEPIEPQITFPELKSLYIECLFTGRGLERDEAVVTNIKALIRGLTAPTLRLLDIRNEIPAPYRDCLEFTRVACAQYTESIRSLHLEIKVENTTDVTCIPLLGFFVTLLDCRDVEAMSLSVDYEEAEENQGDGEDGEGSEYWADAIRSPFILSDADLQSIAVSWPRVQTLSITTTSASKMAAAPAIHVLEDLARLCPSLQSIDLPVLDIPYREELPRLTPAACTVNRSDLQCLRVQHLLNCGDHDWYTIGEVGAYVYELFPRLRTVPFLLTARPNMNVWQLVMIQFAALKMRQFEEPED